MKSRTNAALSSRFASLAMAAMAMAATQLACAHGDEPPTPAPATKPHDAPTTVSAEDRKKELPVTQIPGVGGGAEFYFSPDSKSLIGNLKREGDKTHQVYTFNIDGSNVRRINSIGADACSFYFPDGKRIVWTSTRDHLDLPEGEWSTPWDYPKGAELYSSNLDGTDVKRLTNNEEYDAEVTVRGDGQKIVFGHQTKGKMDLWRANIDGSGQEQITKLEGWEPGGVQYIPGTHKLVFRAWPSAVQEANSKRPKGGHPPPTPMTIFTINDDGTDLKQQTHDDGTNWAPFPAPDGEHYVFAKIFGGRNYEIVLGKYDSPEQKRLTYNDAFDGFPSVSPDGKWISISSSRASKPGERFITAFLIDATSLNIGPKK